jgi:hypothetical protein
VALFRQQESAMLMTILLVLLIVALLGGLPATGLHGHGYWPSGIVGLLLIILIVVILVRGF